MDTVLSARLVTQPDDKRLTIREGDTRPAILEIETEKVVTETRTYEKEFLLKQQQQIRADIVDYLAARDKELEEIDGLLKHFDTLTLEKGIANAKI